LMKTMRSMSFWSLRTHYKVSLMVFFYWKFDFKKWAFLKRYWDQSSAILSNDHESTYTRSRQSNSRNFNHG
jgi:hypothetical protein